MAKRTEPLGGEPVQPEQQPNLQKLIEKLWKQLKVSRIRAENYDSTDLAKGFSIQEELDILTEQHGEEVVTGLKQELSKPRRGQPDIIKPSRLLEEIVINTDPKTGDPRIVSVWRTDVGMQELIDTHLHIYDKETLKDIYFAPPDIRKKILDSFKTIRQNMIYPETGNDIQPIFIVRKNPEKPLECSIFLHYQTKNGEYERDITELVPTTIRDSIQATGKGNTDESFQKWIQEDRNAKRMKEDTPSSSLLEYLRKDTSITDLISHIPEIKNPKPVEISMEPTDEERTAREALYQAQKDKFEKAIEEKKKITAEATKKAQENMEILKNITLPPHLQEYKEFLEEDRGKKKSPLSEQDVSRILFLYKKWEEKEKEREEAEVKAQAKTEPEETERKNRADAEEAEKKAKPAATEKTKEETKKDEEVVKAKSEKEPQDTNIEPDQDELDAIISFINLAEDTHADHEAGKRGFEKFTGETYTIEHVNRYMRLAGLDEISSLSTPLHSDPENNTRPFREKKLTQEERWISARQASERIILRTLVTLTGLLFFKKLAPALEDAWRLRGLHDEKETLLTILSAIEGAQQNIDKEPSAQGSEKPEEKTAREKRKETLEEELTKKEDALKNHIRDLAKKGIIHTAGADVLYLKLKDVLDTARNKGVGIQEKTEKNIIRIFKTYILRKAERGALLKEGLNIGSVMLGLQTARAFSYGILSIYQRTQRRLMGHEQRVREGKEEEKRAYLKDLCKDFEDLTANVMKEFIADLKSISFSLRGLRTYKRISQKEWTTETQSAEKAIGNIMIFLGMTALAGAEIHSTGWDSIGSLQHQIDNLLHTYKTKGAMQAVVESSITGADRALLGTISGAHFILHTSGIEQSILSGIHDTDTMHEQTHPQKNVVPQPEKTPQRLIPPPAHLPRPVEHPEKVINHDDHRQPQKNDTQAEKSPAPAPIQKKSNKITYVPEPPHIQNQPNQTLEAFRRAHPDLLKTHTDTTRQDVSEDTQRAEEEQVQNPKE